MALEGRDVKRAMFEEEDEAEREVLDAGQEVLEERRREEAEIFAEETVLREQLDITEEAEEGRVTTCPGDSIEDPFFGLLPTLEVLPPPPADFATRPTGL